MNAKRWLRHISTLGARARRRFLRALFRLPLLARPVSPPPPPPAATASDAGGGTDFTFRVEDCTVRLMSTADARPPTTGGEDTGASFSPSRAAGEELTAALAALVPSAAAFPLAVYLSHARTGFRDAHEWVHYGVASRRASRDALLAPYGAPEGPAGETAETVFVIHCTRDAPDAAPHTAATPRPPASAPAHGTPTRRPSGY